MLKKYPFVLNLMDAAGDDKAGSGGAADTKTGDDTGGAGSAGAAGGAPNVSSGGSDSNAGDGKEKITWPENWRTQLTTDPKELKQLERYQSPQDIWKKSRALEQRMSSGELKAPLSRDATPEQIAQWRTENGIPATPAEYAADLKLSDEDKPIINKYLEKMHTLNAHPSAVKAGIEWYYQEVERVNQERAVKDKEVVSATEETLRAEWGQEYKLNLNMVNGLLATAPEAVRDEFTHGRLANGEPIMGNAQVMKWLNGLAREINPVTTVVPGAGANIASAIEDEIASIEKLMVTDRKAYNEDNKKQERLRELYGARDRLNKK